MGLHGGTSVGRVPAALHRLPPAEGQVPRGHGDRDTAPRCITWAASCRGAAAGTSGGAGPGAVTAESDFDAPGRGGPGQEESVPAGV